MTPLYQLDSASGVQKSLAGENTKDGSRVRDWAGLGISTNGGPAAVVVL